MTEISELERSLEAPAVDVDAAARAARDFLLALGVSCDTESMEKSPRRMAEAYAALFTARPFEMTTFPNDEEYDELVVVRSIPVQSVCEHHFLPFTGLAHVGYLPGQRIVGLSKLARIVEMFARRPQVQERLTQQIADWVDLHLAPKGGRRGHRGRTRLHDVARRAGCRHDDEHLGASRCVAGEPAVEGRVPRLLAYAGMIEAGPLWRRTA